MEFALGLIILIMAGVLLYLVKENIALRKRITKMQEQEVLVAKMRTVGKYVKGNNSLL